MCTCLWRFDPDPDTRLILLFARDEQKQRPTASLHRWPNSGVIAGRDLMSGGTWLGVNGKGQMVAITYFRDLRIPRKPAPPSRGMLASEILNTELSQEQQMTLVSSAKESMDPFNLLVGDADGLTVYSWIGERMTFSSGTSGMSNGPLSPGWAKVARGVANLESWSPTSDPFSVLEDEREASDQELPDTGLPLELERKASAIFVKGAAYGTRSLSCIRWMRDGRVEFTEHDIVLDTVKKLSFSVG